MKANAWISRYQWSADDDEIASRIERRASPILLRAVAPEVEVEQLKSQMRQVFLCSDQIKQALKQLLALAEGHAKVHFSSPRAVVEGIYRTNPWGMELTPATLLTGLAGVGKTELISALERLLGGAAHIDVPGHENIPLVPAWFMTMRDGVGLNTLVRPWLDATTKPSVKEGGPKKKDLRIPQLLELARRVSRRDGVCLILADEFQFITHSSQANTMAAAVLLQLLSIGPRLIYSANYSLGHRLKARRQEDRQRLLVHPIHLQPEPVDSPDWTRLLDEYLSIAPEDFKFSGEEVADLIYQYTFGIKRPVVELLAIESYVTHDTTKAQPVSSKP